MSLEVETTFEDESAEEDAAEGELDVGAELSDEEPAPLVADAAELAEAPVPTGGFCRRCRAPSTFVAEATDKIAKARRSRQGIGCLRYMVIAVVGDEGDGRQGSTKPAKTQSVSVGLMTTLVLTKSNGLQPRNDREKNEEPVTTARNG